MWMVMVALWALFSQIRQNSSFSFIFLFFCWIGGLLGGGCWLSRMVAVDVTDSSPKKSAAVGAGPTL